MTRIERHLRQVERVPLLLVGACLLWASAGAAEECSSPCTITRAGLPTLRLENTVSGVPDWDLETSAFGVELAWKSDSPTVGAFRLQHHARPNALVIGWSGRVGIGTAVPIGDLHISDFVPLILLDDTSSGAGRSALGQTDNEFLLFGNDLSSPLASFDTRAPVGSFEMDELGRIGIGESNPEARLHVAGDAVVTGNVALGSSRGLKTDFGPVHAAQILARVVALPVASWRYKSEDSSARHIGPFAEDFQRLFGLGNGETISVVDAQGVALAAIQGLEQRLAETEAAWQRKLAAKDAELERVRSESHARIAELAERLTAQHAELTERLAAIEEEAPTRAFASGR